MKLIMFDVRYSPTTHLFTAICDKCGETFEHSIFGTVHNWTVTHDQLHNQHTSTRQEELTTLGLIVASVTLMFIVGLLALFIN